jgi:hypothetical protein
MVKTKTAFTTGAMYMTRGVNSEVAANEVFAKSVTQSLARYVNHDWGEMSADDKRANNQALRAELRIFAAYETEPWKIWIITEADRSATTILFPDEY